LAQAPQNRAALRKRKSSWASLRMPQRITATLQKKHWLRLHGLCMGLLVMLVMWAVTAALLHSGVHSMALRYAISLGVGYGVYLLALRLWAAYLVRNAYARKRGDSWVDGVDPTPGLQFGERTPDWEAGGGGDLGGGGASGDWVDTEVSSAASNASEASNSWTDAVDVVDIGGGSTEFIIGEGFESQLRESLQMGCVSYTQRFFRDGKITPARYAQAYTAARVELMGIEHGLRRLGWQESIGASGTIRAVGLAIKSGGFGNGEVNAEGIGWLKRKLFKLGDVEKIDIDGVKPDRRGVFPAGLAILEAIFDALEISSMTHSEGALREGVLYDLLGRHHDEDIRDRSLSFLMERYHVDMEQAARVEAKALEAFDQVAESWNLDQDWHRELLAWAARVHEVGLDIAHYHYHKHGAYLIEHSDLPGFSRQDQLMLALLVRGHRRNIPQDKFGETGADADALVRLCILLRFAILFHHIRGANAVSDVQLKADERSLELIFPTDWLNANPLTRADFEAEAAWLARVGYDLRMK